MKILAIADRSPRKSLKETLAGEKIDLIATLGDLSFPVLSELQDAVHIPKLGVYGNHCVEDYFAPLAIKNMHLATFTYGGMTFGGFEGSVRYKSDPHEKLYTQEEARKLLENFPRVDVMLVHCPPYGVNDEPEGLAHQGFKALTKYLEKNRPGYLLHGHTYPSAEQMIYKFLGTEIIYVSGDKVVEIQ